MYCIHVDFSKNWKVQCRKYCYK